MKTRLLAFVLLLIAPLAMGQPAVKIAKFLQLTPDQISAWKQINADTRTIVQPLAGTARDQQKQLSAALDEATPDPAKIGNLALVLHATRVQLRSARKDAQAKRFAVLTPEQKTRFEALIALRRLR